MRIHSILECTTWYHDRTLYLQMLTVIHNKSVLVAACTMANQKANESFKEIPLYDVVEAGVQKEPDYFTISTATTNEESMYTTCSGVPSSGVPDKENTNGHSRKIFRLVVIVSLVAMLVLIACLIISCLIAVFVEIGKLKTATRELQQASVDTQAATSKLSESIEQQLGQVNDSLSQQMQISHQQLRQEFFQRLDTSISRISEFLPIPSCAALLALSPSAPSGEYRVVSSNGSAVRVYCDMTLSCYGVTGWMRVAELDMTDSSQQCPAGFIERGDGNIRTCGTPNPGCAAATFPVVSEYDKVCGKIIAFQRGTPETFRMSGGIDNIESNYLDGVSLTHGSPRQHIWSFAAGFNCACSHYSDTYSYPPIFVGDNYFCDTGSHDHFDLGTFYGADPLWDGAGCKGRSTCCTFNNPPWFSKYLPLSTTDAIEMRVCTDQDRRDEDIQIQTIEIFVQ